MYTKSDQAAQRNSLNPWQHYTFCLHPLKALWELYGNMIIPQIEARQRIIIVQHSAVLQHSVCSRCFQAKTREQHSPHCPYLMLLRLLPPLPPPVKEVAQFSKLALKTAPSCSELLIASL